MGNDEDNDRLLLTRSQARRLIDILTEDREDIDVDSPIGKVMSHLAGVFDEAQSESGDNDSTYDDVELAGKTVRVIGGEIGEPVGTQRIDTSVMDKSPVAAQTEKAMEKVADSPKERPRDTPDTSGDRATTRRQR